MRYIIRKAKTGSLEVNNACLRCMRDELIEKISSPNFQCETYDRLDIRYIGERIYIHGRAGVYREWIVFAKTSPTPSFFCLFFSPFFALFAPFATFLSPSPSSSFSSSSYSGLLRRYRRVHPFSHHRPPAGALFYFECSFIS